MTGLTNMQVTEKDIIKNKFDFVVAILKNGVILNLLKYYIL